MRLAITNDINRPRGVDNWLARFCACSGSQPSAFHRFKEEFESPREQFPLGLNSKLKLNTQDYPVVSISAIVK